MELTIPTIIPGWNASEKYELIRRSSLKNSLNYLLEADIRKDFVSCPNRLSALQLTSSSSSPKLERETTETVRVLTDD